MALDAEYREYLERTLNECDAALAGKPNLATIFDQQWRRSFRTQILNAQSPAEVAYPTAYAKHHQDTSYPQGYQDRLEHGGAVLFPLFDQGERNHFLQRMRGNGCTSAEEELLLAYGFSKMLGVPALTYPQVTRGQPRGELHVSVSGRAFEIEAKGLLDSAEVQQLNEFAVRSGRNHWVSFSSTIEDLGRVRRAVAEKLLVPTTADARILVLTQYTMWPTPDQVVPLLRDMALTPGRFNVPTDQHPLGVAYIWGRWIAAVWFNQGVLSRLGLGSQTTTVIRDALRQSFYPRNDSVFFDERQDDEEHRGMLAQMIRRAAGG